MISRHTSRALGALAMRVFSIRGLGCAAEFAAAAAQTDSYCSQYRGSESELFTKQLAKPVTPAQGEGGSSLPREIAISDAMLQSLARD